MKIYKVKVNGKIYQVELESVEETNQSIKSEHKKPMTSDFGETINAPMQGIIQKISVQPGDSVKKGDSLLILEAMKLENDITAEKDGTIEAVLVQVGETVDNNQPLLKVR